MTALEFQFELINHQKKLMMFAYRLTSDRENASDLLQETNLKALKNCNKFNRDTNFKAWTYTIMKNSFINSYRYNMHRLVNDKQELCNVATLNTRIDHANDPVSVYSVKEVEKTIEALESGYKIPFTMFVEGYKYNEIAEILHLNIGTVKSRIFLARKQLKAQLQK